MKTPLSFCHLRQLRNRMPGNITSIRNQTLNSSTSRPLQTDTKHDKPGAKKQDMFRNPLSRLQPYLQVPILSDKDEVFAPPHTEIEQGRCLFRNDLQKKHEIKFHTAAVRSSKLADFQMPEVAFLGRSNVGKSSLIQAMFSEVPNVEVRVSRKPGHTKTLNFFQVGKSFSLVDMPGYGYNMPDHFQESVEKYLQTRRRLCRTFILIDGQVGLTKTDEVGLKMMEEFKIPYVVVMTKIDKAGRHTLVSNLLSFLEVRNNSTGHCCFPQPFLVSSKSGEGLALLQTFIAYITGCIHVEGL
ncbi:GTP-binding protein 8-like [Haliotis rufescens]|uniref:GTP-binding protein 8-like n=1 Tax=Haliotis rufescens TaxID=6454 RepID=UPI00201F982A|nr:GTP-binding protein 8-like [Haliotis rufescens]XP_046369415.2 GTP-binding protein 8-like [Haliotis rufescens]